MKYIFLICLFISCVWTDAYAQEKTYSLDKNKDIILSGIGIGLNIVGYSLEAKGATIEELNGLNENDLWSLDRSAIYNSSQTAQTLSDIILYSSMSIPFMIYTDMKCRSEGLTIGLMGLETFLLTNGITTITKVAVERYRPFTYNQDLTLDERLSEGSTLSFFSGHTSVTTSLSIFGAKVLTDLRPGYKYNWLIWTIGATSPAVIGYLRYEAGKHFLTDVITGYALGAIVGYMVPAAHLNNNVNLGVGLAGTLDFRYTF